VQYEFTKKNKILKKYNGLILSGKCNIGGNVTIDQNTMTSLLWRHFYDVTYKTSVLSDFIGAKVDGSHHLLFSKSEKPETVQYLKWVNL